MKRYMKKNDGSMTIEASLALFFIFVFFLAFLTIARYARIQNRVKHSLQQTVMEMSSRNQMMSSTGAALKKIIGINAGDVSKLMDRFGAKITGGIEKFTLPYSEWKDETVFEDEVTRFFAAHMLDSNFDDMSKKSISWIKDELKKQGIEDLAVEGGAAEGKYLSKSSNGHGVINIKITYKINTGVSFQSFFGISTMPEFTESIKFPLLS